MLFAVTKPNNVPDSRPCLFQGGLYISRVHISPSADRNLLSAGRELRLTNSHVPDSREEASANLVTVSPSQRRARRHPNQISTLRDGRDHVCIRVGRRCESRAHFACGDLFFEEKFDLGATAEIETETGTGPNEDEEDRREERQSGDPHVQRTKAHEVEDCSCWEKFHD